MPPSARTATLGVGLALLLVAAGYLPAILYSGYVWDDWDLFVISPGLHNADLLWSTLTSPILQGTTYFRPLVLATFAAEFMTLGAIPAVSHVVNLGIHLATSALVAVATRQFLSAQGIILPGWKMGLIAAIYGLHPALVEPTAWASGRFDLMVAFFGALSLVVFQQSPSWKRTVALPLVFLMAALSKEAAVVLPLLWAAIFLAQRRGWTWRATFTDAFKSHTLWPLTACFVAGLAYLGFRAASIESVAHVDTNVASQIETPLQHLGFVGLTVLHYLKTTVAPFLNISPQHPFDVGAMTIQDTATGIVAVLLIAGFTLLALHRRHPGGLLIASGLAALAPVLNILPLTIGENLGHDRFLALPLIPVAMALGLAKVPAWVPEERHARWRLYGHALAAAWVIVCFLTVRSVVPLWGSDLGLWGWAYQKHPESTYVRNNYAGTLMTSGRLHEAKEVLGPIPVNQMVPAEEILARARLFLLMGDLDRAERSVAAIEGLIHRKDAAAGISTDSVLGLGSTKRMAIYLQIRGDIGLASKDYPSALKWTEQLVSQNPRYLAGIQQRAMALSGAGRHDEAIKAMQELEAMTPSTTDSAAWAAYTRYIRILCTEDSRKDACEHLHVIEHQREES